MAKDEQEKQAMEKRDQQLEEKEQEINKNNEMWEATVREKNKDWQKQIDAMREERNILTGRVTQLELKNIELQRILDEGDAQVLRAQLDNMKSDNDRIQKEQDSTFTEYQQKIERMRKDCEVKIEQCKEREKGFYREEI